MGKQLGGCRRLRIGVMAGIMMAIAADSPIDPSVLGDRHYIQTLDPDLLQPGDLIFRQGEGWAGQTLAWIDRSTSYSHVGIIALVEEQPFVIHASVGAVPESQEAGIVRMESLEAFLARDTTVAIAISRLTIPDVEAQHLAVTTAETYANQHLPFDHSFDLSTPNQLYCTELVWRSYQAAGLDLVNNQFDQLTLPFGNPSQHYLFPDRLLNSPHLSVVYTLHISPEPRL